MQIVYKTLELRTFCESRELSEEKWGAAVAEQLISRVADIKAAGTPLELFQGTPQLVGLGATRLIIIQLAEGWCFKLAPNPIGSSTAGTSENANWHRVGRVAALTVEGCHD